MQHLKEKTEKCFLWPEWKRPEKHGKGDLACREAAEFKDLVPDFPASVTAGALGALILEAHRRSVPDAETRVLAVGRSVHALRDHGVFVLGSLSRGGFRLAGIEERPQIGSGWVLYADYGVE